MLRDRAARALADGPGRLRAMGAPGRGHRPGDGRRRHRDRRGRPRRGRPAAARRPGARPHPGPRPDQRRDRPRSGSPRRPPASPAPRPAPGAAGRAATTACRSGGWTRAPSSSPSLGSANLASRALGLPSSTTSTVQTNTVAGPATARRSCGSRARPRRSSRRPTANQAVGALDPWLGAALSVAEATRNVADHRGPAARRHELPQLRRSDAARRRSGSSARRSAASATPAARSACRSPAATSRSTTNRRPGRSRPTPEIGVVGLLDDVDARVGPAFAGAGDAVVLVGESTPGLGRQRLRRPGRRGGGGRAAGDRPRSRGGAPAVHPGGGRARARRVGPGRLAAAASPSPSRSAAIWGGLGRAVCGSPVGGSPAVELFGESPSRLVADVPAAPRPGARAARPPVRAAGRARSGSSAATAS